MISRLHGMWALAHVQGCLRSTGEGFQGSIIAWIEAIEEHLRSIDKYIHPSQRHDVLALSL